MIERTAMTADGMLAEAESGAMIVTAGKRLSRALRVRYDAWQQAQGRDVWSAPRILPWGAWLGELRDALLYSKPGALPVALGKEQELALWEQVIADSPESGGLLQIPPTAAAAMEAAALAEERRLSRAEMEARGGEDSRAWLGWLRAFEGRAAAGGCTPQSRTAALVAQHLPLTGSPSRMVLAGFDELTPQQREFLEACGRAGLTVIEAAAPAPEEVRATRAAFATREDELRAAACWARELLEAGEDGIAVVVRGLKQARAAVERIFLEVLDPGSVLPGAPRRKLLNISAGPGLASYPIIRAALLVLELSPQENEMAVVSRLLRCPHLAGAEAERSERAALDARLRSQGGDRVAIEALIGLAAERRCGALARNLEAWRRERGALPQRQSPAEWARAFSRLLKALGLPGNTPASEEYQALAKWRDVCSDLAGLGAVLPPITYSEAVRRFRRMASECVFQPETTEAAVEILGEMETAGLEFKHLWIAGLDDESWPEPARPPAFIPAAVARERGLPHSSPERELAFAERITRRLLAAAPDVIASYPTREEDRELGPSPLIRHLPQRQPDAGPFVSYREVIRAAAPEKPDSVDDRMAPPVAEGAAKGGTNIFKYQAQCPFRAFAELRLDAEALDSPTPGLNPFERGSLIHRVLELVWKDLRTHQRLCEASEAELQAVVRGAAESAVAGLAAGRAGGLDERFAALECKRLERAVLRWLEIEKARAPFTVVFSEEPRQKTVGGVRVRMQVDRVDRLEDGREIIVDYKSGTANARAWEGDRPDEPQIPLYAITHEPPLAAVAFARLKLREQGFSGLAEADGLLPGVRAGDLQHSIAEWREVLDGLGKAFRAGDAAVNPKKAAVCRHCELGPLCRFSEAETPASRFEERGNGDA